MRFLIIFFIASIAPLLFSKCRSSNARPCNIDSKIDSLIEVFHKLNDTTMGDTMLRDLKISGMSIQEIKSIYGEPVAEYIDTFDYGENITVQNHFGDNGYDFFEPYYRTIPRIIVHTFYWPLGENRALTIYCAENSTEDLTPIWGHNNTYNSNWIPFWALDDVNLTKAQLVDKYGQPKSENVDTICNGMIIYRTVYMQLKQRVNKTETIVHSYEWQVDSVRKLRMYFNESNNDTIEKPIWGFQYLPQVLYYE